MAKEEILQYIWRHQLIFRGDIRTTCGRRLKIIRPGEQNFHAGPDFFNARIKIDQLVWAGNVEIHQNASDWLKHGHHEDPSYDNVILHVVRNCDVEIRNSHGRRIPALILDFPGHIISRYETLRTNESWLPCNMYIMNAHDTLVQQWFRHLQAERLSQKTHRINTILKHQGLGREEILYRAMGSGFGLPINSLPFEMLTTGIPLLFLIELRDHIQDLESLLFSQSGFLQTRLIHGPYDAMLLKNYQQKASCFPGKPVPLHLWKFFRLRPASFPTLRISQFASLIHHRFPLTDSLLSCSSITELEQLLRVRASKYWDTHYVFGKGSPPSVKYLGFQFIRTLIINVIVPFLSLLGEKEQRPGANNKAKAILLELQAESNQIVKKWTNFGMKPGNAFESQALIQLYNNYCQQKRCLECQLGMFFIQSNSNER